jgi:hypothetical protein
MAVARRPFISGNWKLNPQSRDEAVKLASEIAASITPSSPVADIALFVPYVFIESAMNSVQGKLQVGAEVCYMQPVMLPQWAAGIVASIDADWRDPRSRYSSQLCLICVRLILTSIFLSYHNLFRECVPR